MVVDILIAIGFDYQPSFTPCASRLFFLLTGHVGMDRARYTSRVRVLADKIRLVITGARFLKVSFRHAWCYPLASFPRLGLFRLFYTGYFICSLSTGSSSVCFMCLIGLPCITKMRALCSYEGHRMDWYRCMRQAAAEIIWIIIRKPVFDHDLSIYDLEMQRKSPLT